MVDIIISILASIFVIAGGAFLGYNFCKIRERKKHNEEGVSFRNRLIGKDDLILIGADIISFASFEDADARKAERKAFIALCKASDTYRWMTDDQIEEDAGRYFDARMEESNNG